MRSWIARRMLRATAERYGYDTSYLEMMLKEAPAAFFKFATVMKAASHREVVPVEAEFAAKIVGALAEDCGPCTQLVRRHGARSRHAEGADRSGTASRSARDVRHDLSGVQVC